jgi:hypothetical protein
MHDLFGLPSISTLGTLGPTRRFHSVRRAREPSLKMRCAPLD